MGEISDEDANRKMGLVMCKTVPRTVLPERE